MTDWLILTGDCSLNVLTSGRTNLANVRYVQERWRRSYYTSSTLPSVRQRYVPYVPYQRPSHNTHLPSFCSSTSPQYQQSIQTPSLPPSLRPPQTTDSADPARPPSWDTATATALSDARRISGRGSNVIPVEWGKRIYWNVLSRGGGRFTGSGCMPRYVLDASKRTCRADDRGGGAAYR